MNEKKSTRNSLHIWKFESNKKKNLKNLHKISNELKSTYMNVKLKGAHFFEKHTIRRETWKSEFLRRIFQLTWAIWIYKNFFKNTFHKKWWENWSRNSFLHLQTNLSTNQNSKPNENRNFVVFCHPCRRKLEFLCHEVTFPQEITWTWWFWWAKKMWKAQNMWNLEKNINSCIKNQSKKYKKKVI